jgi:AcrR family transcriptional regulator
MPKDVDHDERRRDIIDATLRILARSGPRGVTIRAVAAELGGSASVVTHYYPRRRDLLDDLVSGLSSRWEQELAELDASPEDGARARLRRFLVWLLALDRGRVEERAWLSLLTAPEADQVSIATLHADGETWTREALQLRLRGLVEEDRLGQTSNILHVAVVGLIVSSEENPSVWPNDHQLEILDALLSLLGLDLTQPD